MSNIYEQNATTEEEILRLSKKMAGVLASTYTFPGYDFDDISQEIFIISYKFLERGQYDPERGNLDDVLFINCKNRLKNLVRDKNFRSESPCKKCPFFDKKFECSDNQCAKFPDRFDCDLFRNYQNKKNRQASLFSPENYESVDYDLCNEVPSELLSRSEKEYLIEFINDNLAPSLRGDLLKTLSEIPLSAARRENLIEGIRDLIKESGSFPELEDYLPENANGEE